MRFIVREGTDPVAGADRAMLAAMGMPAGGVISIGATHVLIRPRRDGEASSLFIGPRSRSNAGIDLGASVDATRAILSTAGRVVVDGDALPLEPRIIIRALQGRPATVGDTITIDARYLGGAEPVDIRVVDIEPSSAGIINQGSLVLSAADHADSPAPAEHVADRSAAPVIEPRATAALLKGLESELDILTGWLALLTSPKDLPKSWGLPEVAGVILEGPSGVGKTELVRTAAEDAGATFSEVSLDLVFKPERLLDLLEKAKNTTAKPGVIFVDRLEAVTGEEGMVAFKSQIGAILRWFTDAISETPALACVLGVASVAHLDQSISKSALLPRTLTIPPPDLERRRLMFEEGLRQVPTDGLDPEQLAARSAGFSGSDIMAAIVHASAMVARSGEPVTQDRLLAAIKETSPSLGSVSLGEMPTYGFDKVANLSEEKQRLTESVIWPMTQPERFAEMGIEPPRGILLYGPPGTGKTFVIRALAHESGAAFFAVKGAELLDKYVGESERGVRDVFSRARAAAPSIIFFDELDALAPVRGSSTTSVTDSVVAALLTELDGVGGRGDVVVIGATNRRDLIDPALLRSGRFEVHIHLDLPTAEARRSLLGITDVP
ncbi:MAG: AAA family ATPase, partial [Acidimicrobiia bacterium]|nr:AAA family ATPase [Acidimicrobiia bacterium]